MNIKLMLIVDKDVIDVVKKYVKLNGRSFFNIIEEYLKFFVENKLEESDFEISFFV